MSMTKLKSNYIKLVIWKINILFYEGGFVGGLIKDNRRIRENIVSRSMLTLDVDNASTELISNFEKHCDYKACLYTTHSHRSTSPRCCIW